MLFPDILYSAGPEFGRFRNGRQTSELNGETRCSRIYITIYVHTYMVIDAHTKLTGRSLNFRFICDSTQLHVKKRETHARFRWRSDCPEARRGAGRKRDERANQNRIERATTFREPARKLAGYTYSSACGIIFLKKRVHDHSTFMPCDFPSLLIYTYLYL